MEYISKSAYLKSPKIPKFRSYIHNSKISHALLEYNSSFVSFEAHFSKSTLLSFPKPAQCLRLFIPSVTQQLTKIAPVSFSEELAVKVTSEDTSLALKA